MAGAVAALRLAGDVVGRGLGGRSPCRIPSSTATSTIAVAASMTRQVVAIDGPSGSGKSTVARGVADALGLPTLDTGAMYRAVTLAALERDVADRRRRRLRCPVADRCDIVVDGTVLLDGRDVTPRSAVPRSPPPCRPSPRTRACGRCWSPASGPGWTHHGGGVVEGRDIGTVVFPDAPVKVFLTASDDGPSAAPPATTRPPRARSSTVDHGATRPRRGATRSTRPRAQSPLVAAPDAIVIDTTDARGRRYRHRRSSAGIAKHSGRGRGEAGRVSFYRFARAVVLSVFKVVFRVQVVGREHVPPTGVVHPRALAPLDPRHPLRRLHQQASHALHGQGRAVLVAFGGWLFRKLGAVSVDRDVTDRPRSGRHEQALEGGEPVAIFPEGTRATGPSSRTCSPAPPTSR